MIRLEGVNKYFNKGKRNELHVINNTTLELGSSGLVALLGPSGSGKTTLLNTIGGLDRVNKGDIYVDGKKITGRSAAKIDKIRNLNIGYIFQDYKLVENMTVYENVSMVLKMIGIKDEGERKKRINYILESVGMYRYRNRMAGMLSGGERQRVGIARALAKNPKIIIADEPTGNLDSGNTIEIMNIIKAISKDRLVVLVTHEVELAKFYASRIIELKDGKIENDYENITDDSLNYRIDNKFYLKDFEKQENASTESVKMNFYGNKNDDIGIDIVVNNGNIYIKSRNNQHIEVVDNNSSIEFVDDHFQEMDKSLYEDYKFEFDNIVDSNVKEKYSSIIGIWPSLKNGFRKIASYPLIKKLLLIGFVLAGIFITYSYSSIYASFDIHDKDFINSNRSYLYAKMPNISVEKYEEYEKLPSVEYMLPKDGNANFVMDLNYYYQTSYAQNTLNGALTDINHISEEDILYGRMPENAYEIVADKLTVETMFKRGYSNQVGINSVEDVLDTEVKIANMKPFKVVGITDSVQPVIYMDKSLMLDVLYNSRSENQEEMDDSAGESNILNYETVDKAYTLKQGRLPQNDYETIIPYSQRYDFPLNKQVDEKVNDKKLTVVGYYESSENLNVFLVNQSTIKYAMVSKAGGFTVAPTDKEEAISEFRDGQNVNIKDTYASAKKEYTESRRSSTKMTLILGLIVLGISLIEILLMTRSSFLSRIKEIGIFRAIGVKKTDIYKMFMGEILALTTVSSLLGIIGMSYALSKLCKISYISTMFAMNPVVFFGAIITVYVFNSIVGLIPVFNTMRKTPAAILARYDVD